MGSSITTNLGIPIVDADDHVARESINDAIEVIDKNALNKTHADSSGHWSVWKASTDYALQDVFRADGIPSWAYFEVTQAGTSGSSAPTATYEGQVLTDGTCELVVRRLISRIDVLKFYNNQTITSDETVTRNDLPKGISSVEVHDGSKTTYPITAGNTIRILGSNSVGICELLCGYCDSGTQGTAHLYYRNMSTSGNVWSDWSRILFSGEEKTIKEWVPNTEYIVDDIVRRGSKLFVCTTANRDSTFTSSNWMQLDGLDTYIPNWVANHSYKADDVVMQSGKLYRANTAHTSTSSFDLDIANWDSVKGADPYLLEWTAHHSYIKGEVVVVDNKLYMANQSHKSGMDFTNDTSNWNLIEGADPYIPSWSANHDYKTDEVVISDKKLYRATTKHTSTTSLTADMAYWEKIGSLDPYAPDWESNHDYKKNEIVVSGSKLYRAITAHQSTTDILADLANWELIEGKDTYIPSWESSHAYKQTEVIINERKLYRANTAHTSSSDFKADISKWELIAGDDPYIPEWTAQHEYKQHEVVSKDSKLYIAVLAHTSSSDFSNDTANWKQVSGFFTQVSDWETGYKYYATDVVIYGSKLYRARLAHTSTSFDTDLPTYWELIEGADPNVPNWKSTHDYNVGEVVISGGKLYRANTAHTSTTDFSADESNWDLVGGDDPYIPDWTTENTYKEKQVVVENKHIYRALQQHTASTNFSQDLANWESLGGAGGISVWTAGTSYEDGQLVTNNGLLYKALQSHTSGTDFVNDLANWELVTANINEWTKSTYYPLNTIVRSDDNLYRCTTAHTSTTSIIADIADWQIIGGSSSGANSWQSNTFYSDGQLVEKDYVLYKAVSRHISSSDFATDASKWHITFSNIVPWESNVYYFVGSTVINGTGIYQCTTAHTSSADFSTDSANWKQIGGDVWSSQIATPSQVVSDMLVSRT